MGQLQIPAGPIIVVVGNVHGSRSGDDHVRILTNGSALEWFVYSLTLTDGKNVLIGSKNHEALCSVINGGVSSSCKIEPND